MLQNPFDLIDQRLANIEGLLLDIKHPSLPAKSQKTEFITREEAADILRITLPTLHSRTLEGKIKGYRNGRRILYKKNEIENAITEISTFKKRRI